MHACERCYARKTKCDRVLPHCSSCLKSHSRCVYSNKRRDRELQREYLRALELRVKELEDSNQQLRREAANGTASQPEGSANLHPSRPSSSSTADQNKDQQYSGDQDEADRVDDGLQRPIDEVPRYLGSSNGAGFVDVVERAIQPSQTVGGLFGRVTDDRNASSEIEKPTSSEPCGLVDRSVAMPLIESYFSHWHIIFPVIYRPAFMEMTHQLFCNPQIYQEDHARAFAIDIVLALGSISTRRMESPMNAESHFLRALNNLNKVSSFRDIRSLQAWLLYCEYGIHASLRDTSSEMWEVLGKATRLCVELGLHLNSSKVSIRCQSHITGTLPEEVQLEMQNRCFWCYYNLERIVNLSLGRPMTLHDDDMSTLPPSTADDDDLEHHSITPNQSLPSLSPFLHHIRLRKIQSKIHRCMYTNHSIQALPIPKRKALRNEILNELYEWRNEVSLLELSQEHTGQGIPSSYRHPSWYQALFHSACLLLYRPSTTFPAMQDSEISDDSDSVLRIIWNSSRLVLANYLELLRARRLNYSWVCLYTIFMAGLANIYSVGCCVQRRKKVPNVFLPPFWLVNSDIRDCTNILTAICERWDDARASYDIFNHLGTTALKELAGLSFCHNDGGAMTLHSNHDMAFTSHGTDLSMNKRNEDFQIDPSSTSVQPQGSISSRNPDYLVPQLDQYFSDSILQTDPIVDFQQVFQDMQDAVVRVDSQADEVMLGFSQDWFVSR